MGMGPGPEDDDGEEEEKETDSSGVGWRTSLREFVISGLAEGKRLEAGQPFTLTSKRHSTFTVRLSPDSSAKYVEWGG